MVKALPDILARIVETKKAELAHRSEGLEERAQQSIKNRRDFARALNSTTPAIIAEIKKASPSKGVFAHDFDPCTIALRYAQGGAAALSVLTDEKHFQGHLADLESARAVTNLPALRKDFTIDEYHVHEAAAHGADAILLIAAILTEKQMRDFRELAERYKMAVLVEVHDHDELQHAIHSGARIIGVNNRDLHTFKVDLGVALALSDKIPANVLRVAESGIHSAADLRKLQSVGYQVFLIGEHLMKSGDPTQALRDLVS